MRRNMDTTVKDPSQHAQCIISPVSVLPDWVRCLFWEPANNFLFCHAWRWHWKFPTTPVCSSRAPNSTKGSLVCPTSRTTSSVTIWRNLAWPPACRVQRVFVSIPTRKWCFPSRTRPNSYCLRYFENCRRINTITLYLKTCSFSPRHEPV